MSKDYDFIVQRTVTKEDEKDSKFSCDGESLKGHVLKIRGR